MKCFVNKMNFGFNCVEIYVHSSYYQFKLHHQSDCTCLLNKYGFLYWYDRTYYLEFNILDIFKGSREYFEIHLHIKVICILFILFINKDK